MINKRFCIVFTFLLGCTNPQKKCKSHILGIWEGQTANVTMMIEFFKNDIAILNYVTKTSKGYIDTFSVIDCKMTSKRYSDGLIIYLTSNNEMKFYRVEKSIEKYQESTDIIYATIFKRVK